MQLHILSHWVYLDLQPEEEEDAEEAGASAKRCAADVASTSGQQPAPRQGKEALPEQQQQQQQEQEQLQQPPPEETQFGPPAQAIGDQEESMSGAGPCHDGCTQTDHYATHTATSHPSAKSPCLPVLKGGKRRVTARTAAT